MRRSTLVLVLTLWMLVPHAAIGQDVRSDKPLNELLLDVAEMVPEFAGIVGGDSLKILVTATRPGLLEEARAALDEVFGKFQFQHYPSMQLVEVRRRANQSSQPS